MKFNNIFKRSILGDYDRDGVMNAFDCQPKNKRKQDTVTLKEEFGKGETWEEYKKRKEKESGEVIPWED